MFTVIIIINAVYSVHTYTHIVWWFLWSSNLYYTSPPSTRERNSHLDATTEQNADLDPEWLELGTDHITCMPGLSKQLPQYHTVFQGQWAAELLKKQITSTYWNSVEPGFGSLSAPHHCLDPQHMENSTCMSSPHHTRSQLLSTFVRTAHAHS